MTTQSLAKWIRHRVFRRYRIISRCAYAIDPQLIYGKKIFYEEARESKSESAKATSDIIVEHFNPASVVDIGCGEGLFLDALYRKGVFVLGCDISNAALEVSPKDFVIFKADATKPIRFNRKFDLCICLEIAEHIPTRHSKTLVKNVTQASDIIFFSAAPPGQGGVGHINEQHPQFWKKLFKTEGFKWDEELTLQLKEQLKEAKVVSWLHKNILIFNREKPCQDR